MTDKDLVDRTNRAIDALLDGHSHFAGEGPGDYLEILQIAQYLAHNDMSPQSRVRGSLRKRLFSRLPNQTPQEAWSPDLYKGNHTMHLKIRPIVFALTALIVLALVFAATPAGQAFAQDLWQRVGPLIIVNTFAPTEAAIVTGATPTPIPGAGGISVPMPTPRPGEGTGQEVQAPDAAASPTPLPVTNGFEPIDNRIAYEKYGFRVLEPGYLPEEYELMIEHQVNRTQDGRLVSLYVYSTRSTAFDSPYLSIQQSTFEDKAPIEFMVGDAKVSHVEVRGNNGTFIEDARLMTVLDNAGKNVTLPVDYLMWEENNHFFVIDATQLSQEEMIRIAESLK